VEHLGFLFAAYAIIFAAIFLYVAFLWRRQSRLEGEILALEKRLEALGGEETSHGQKQEKT
jgi:CcmD family protein